LNHKPVLQGDAAGRESFAVLAHQKGEGEPMFTDSEVAAMAKWLPKDESPFVCESCSDAFLPPTRTGEQVGTGISENFSM
jgi:hypothetical protein